LNDFGYFTLLLSFVIPIAYNIVLPEGIMLNKEYKIWLSNGLFQKIFEHWGGGYNIFSIIYLGCF